MVTEECQLGASVNPYSGKHGAVLVAMVTGWKQYTDGNDVFFAR